MNWIEKLHKRMKEELKEYTLKKKKEWTTDNKEED